MIQKYSEWVKESEKMEANPTPDTTSQASPFAGAPTDTPAQGNEVPLEAPAVETEPIETGETTSPSEETENFGSSVEEWRSLDSARKEATKEFKKKYEEFLQIPDEIRNNPTEETDKTKVETLKSEISELHKTMTAAISSWDSFNKKALGLEDETDPDYEP